MSSLRRKEVFLKPHVKACPSSSSSQIKNSSYFRGVHCGWIWYLNRYLSSYVLSVKDKLYLEKKRLKEIRLVSDNKISKIWAFLFQNLVKWNERNIGWPKIRSDYHRDHPLSNPYFGIWIHQNVRAYPKGKKICIDQWLVKYYCILERIQSKLAFGEQVWYSRYNCAVWGAVQH